MRDSRQVIARIGAVDHYSIGNGQWLRSTYGTKVKKAVELREASAPISIVNEESAKRSIRIALG